MIPLLRRDLKLAFRAGGGFGLGLVFFLILCTLIPFGIGPDAQSLAPVAAGLLWLGALLACLLSLDRLFALDWEDGSLELLATSDLPFEAMATAKALAHWLTVCLPLVVAAPLLGLLLHLPPAAMPMLCISLLVGTPALSWIGTFGAALTVGVKRGGLLMALLVLPLYIPTLVFGSEVVSRVQNGLDPSTPLALLGAISLGSIALLPFATGQALRVNLR